MADRRQRRQDKVKAMVVSALGPSLASSEEVGPIVFGISRPRSWLGIELVVGPIIGLFFTKLYYITTTERRFVALRAKRTMGTQKIAGVEWDDAIENVTVVTYKEKWSFAKLAVKRHGDGRVLRLRLQKTYRHETRLIVEALGGLGQS